MALIDLEIRGGTSWASDPSYYRTDIEAYRQEAAAAMAALKTCGFNYAVKWWAGESEDSMLLVEGDDGERVEFEDPDYVRWEGPNLKVYADGDAKLVWHPKHTDEEMFVDLPLKGEGA
jgi:hypothetical protein